MAKTPIPDLRQLARKRLNAAVELSPEEWVKEVEAARKRGYQLLRFPGLTVEIRDYSLRDH